MKDGNAVIVFTIKLGERSDEKGPAAVPEWHSRRSTVSASVNATKSLGLPKLLLSPYHSAPKRVAIERTRTIRIVLFSAHTNKNMDIVSAFLRGWMMRMNDNTHQISHRRCNSNLNLSYIALTTRPSSLASGPSSSPSSVCADPGDVPTIVSMSTDRP